MINPSECGNDVAIASKLETFKCAYCSKEDTQDMAYKTTIGDEICEGCANSLVCCESCNGYEEGYEPLNTPYFCEFCVG